MKDLGTTIIAMTDDRPENWINQARALISRNAAWQIELGLKTMFVGTDGKGGPCDVFDVGLEEVVVAEYSGRRYWLRPR